MGLDFCGSDAHWAYSGFHRFRVKLAKEIGIDLDNMAGFDGDLPWSEIIDPIKPLLNHSDCDGELTTDQCKGIWPRLRQLIASWPEEDYDKVQAKLLVSGMKSCAKSGTSLIFS